MKQLVFLLLFPAMVWGQNFLSNGYNEDYNRFITQQTREQTMPVFGFGAKLTADLIARHSLAQMRLSVVASMGMGVIESGKSSALFPSYHAEMEVYRGGLGSSLAPSQRSRFNFELRQSFLLTAAVDNAPANAIRRPLVQFISEASHPLADPYKTSITLGTVFINGINHHRSQRVGILSLAYEYFNLTYYNDGPPFDKLFTGDVYDRWWTGGVQLGYYNYCDDCLFPSVELKFEKFTGWEPNGYEVSKFFQLDYIPYRHFDQNYFNQGRWQLNLMTNSGMGVHLSRYDHDPWDVQHFIHLNLDMTRHPPTLKERWAFGTTYDVINQSLIR